MNHWPSKPHQTEPLLLEWARRHERYVTVESLRQWSHTAYALTVTDRSVPDDTKRKCLIDVPHGHEPAGTVACMNYLSRLLEGHALDGSAAPLDRERILRETLLTFIPDANPEGRSRAPEDVWDGIKYSNDEFLKFAFGVDDSTGQRFKRVGRWHTTEESCHLVGVAYERIDETTYVEPNRDWDSSFFRLLKLQRERYRYDQMIGLHQTEFENSPHNCVILLPIVWDDLPAVIRDYSLPWAQEITAAWQQIAGATPQEPRALNYTGEQRAYFEQRWGDIYREVPCFTVEVQNNNPRTSPALQLRLAEAAIEISVERLLRD